MQTVKVAKADLLKRMQENRSKHKAKFEAALLDYKDAVVLELEEWLADARAGKKVSRHTVLHQPQNMTAQYDTVIDMLEMSVEDEIELQRSEFVQYVRDEWHWAQQFGQSIHTNSAYMASKGIGARAENAFFVPDDDE